MVVGMDAAEAASLADEMLSQGESLQAVWRYSIIQLLDDYSHDAGRNGTEVASRRFDQEPAPTLSTEVDAALAALTEYLARRDGWPLPVWARCSNAARMPATTWIPVPESPIWAPVASGGPSANPVVLIEPPMACATTS